MQINKNKRKTTCLHPGCNTLIGVHEKGYCHTHKKLSIRQRLDKNKAPNSAKFYGGYLWKVTRAAYKKVVPYCEECKRNKITKEGGIIHHIIDRVVLEKQGKNPYDFKYLENICFNCHQKELQKRRKFDS